MELLSRKGITLKQDEVIREMLALCIKIDHSQVITEMTIKIRRKYSMELPDAIIAASAQSSHLPLLTADKDFARVKEIDRFIIEL